MADKANEYHLPYSKNTGLNRKLLNSNSNPFVPSQMDTPPQPKKVQWKLVRTDDLKRATWIREGKRRRQWNKRQRKNACLFLGYPEKVKDQAAQQRRKEFWTVMCNQSNKNLKNRMTL